MNLVGSSTNGQPPGAVTPLGVKVPKHGQPIRFVAIFVNSAFHDPTKLVFDDLVFTE